MPCEVKGEVVEPQHTGLVAVLRRGAPQQCPQAREQLLQGEGLHHVVVGARVQAGDAVAHSIARGEHEDGRGIADRAQAAADLDAVHPRHHHVEQHRVGCALSQHRQGLVAIRCELDLGAREGQGAPHCGADGLLIVGDQDPHVMSVPNARGVRRAPPRCRDRSACAG